jgi:hypothetical protein
VRNSSARKSLAILTMLALFGLAVAGCSSPGTKATGTLTKIGETVNLDSLKYTVDKVSTTQEVGVPGNIIKYKSGKMVVVDLTVENVSDKAMSFDGEMATVYDSDSNVYELNLEAAAAACNAAGETFKNVWFGSLEPGEKAKTKAVFEIPEGVKGLQVELRSALIGSEKTALVSLGI